MMLLLCRDRGHPRGPYNTGTTHFLALACANTSGLQLRPGSLVTVDRHWHRDSCRRRLSSLAPSARRIRRDLPTSLTGLVEPKRSFVPVILGRRWMAAPV